ncbi:GTP cyclohydrolase II-domain-containing protein [Schizophyllum amplum]|uniref:GTP cyclohydrolase II n=1 Tax=Schizophyllum amplum TaxID=97359 RepID=A0A550CTN3_9AGAR|nr:GTP cyclohydrolase II-domain-containing protein [Auriculariopsis ampla]
MHDHPELVADAALLDFLTGSENPAPSRRRRSLPRRDAELDPLLLAAAASTGPHVTRNHYTHDFFPGVSLPQAEGAWDWSKWKGADATQDDEPCRVHYVSRQAPRSQRLGLEQAEPLPHNVSALPAKQTPDAEELEAELKAVGVTLPGADLPPVEVKCMARTRIPTPHGPAFLHLYHNNRDNKEHLALVIDPAQLSDEPPVAPPIRSRSLDAVWAPDETPMDRITRGAYVGRLSPSSQTPSTPDSHTTGDPAAAACPLIRIHSECFTGETVGSQRCDCGEQLDEAIRRIALAGRGAIVYLRQEGRGIGLLSKLRAYNLQDIGHDTVAANLLLGHRADERAYDVAGAVLRDLGLATGVRVLTNNPDKVAALEEEGLRVVERVPMVPRSWLARTAAVAGAEDGLPGTPADDYPPAGATLIGGGAVHGEDLDKYLRTKVLKMGHMLPLWMEDAVAQ